MKLLELLVQDAINGEHKWPEEAKFAAQDEDCSVYTYVGLPVFDCGEWIDEADNNPVFVTLVGLLERADDFEVCVITREQYEAALAAAQQPVWNGDGLPPVGCVCEFQSEEGGWGVGTVLCVGKMRVFWLCHEDGMEYNAEIEPREFRPIRSEDEKNRDAAVNAMASAPKPCGHAIHGICCEIYEAIAAGKIPGVKIDV